MYCTAEVGDFTPKKQKEKQEILQIVFFKESEKIAYGMNSQNK